MIDRNDTDPPPPNVTPNAMAEAVETPIPITPRVDLPDATDGGIPDWVLVPPGLKIPRNKQVMYLRFRPTMTDTPAKGERQAIIWSNNLGDQKLAIMRSDKDPNKMAEQMAKQMIRAVDGAVADWTGEPGVGNIDIWWDAIGPKCRSILDRLFVQLHVAKQEEMADFFENCVAVRLAGG
jgi:hypothetical protein